jgi:Flp pilus assembly protein TadG
MMSHNNFVQQGAALVRRYARILRIQLLQESPVSARNKSIARCENGESLVSFAVTLPILLSFVFGLTQICLAFYTHEFISDAAREGTRYAIVHGSTCETSGGATCTASAANVNSYVSGLSLPNLGGGTMTVNTTYPDGSNVPGDRVKVNITYTFPYKIPFVTTTPMSITTNSEMYIVQ